MVINWVREKLYLNILGAIFIFALFSCQDVEDDPGKVLVSIKMMDADEPSLNIEEGNIYIEEFLFSAKTEGGNQVTFNEVMAKKVSFTEGDSNNLLNFFIPSAIYDEMQIRLVLKAEESRPSIFLRGTNLRGGLMDLPFVFENTVDELLELNVTPQQMGQPIVVKRGGENSIKLEVNPEVWFQTIGPGQWIAGEVVQFQNQNVVLINNRHNQDMFQVINGRIKQSFSAKFK
ncbi:hypothetical protein QWY93_01890 [Echinicola jeungdonensis]|uniref:DUF4382 domain-containing protein n=1 Tax=Echinicola jeungdonensis TaxID=709343 RepID=A0ABV5J7S7_9BACT|nr:hypothetical protein [Echinicola jeungdonensis]MDN3668085.1 hypothetical protein [Echinicola jeungdonensis]